MRLLRVKTPVLGFHPQLPPKPLLWPGRIQGAKPRGSPTPIGYRPLQLHGNGKPLTERDWGVRWADAQRRRSARLVGCWRGRRGCARTFFLEESVRAWAPAGTERLVTIRLLPV